MTTLTATLAVGQRVTFVRTFTDLELFHYRMACGDDNPLHFSEEYAKTTRFGRRIVHGMLTASPISTVLGTVLPGPGTIYKQQTLDFLRPVYVGETVTATVEIVSIVEAPKLTEEPPDLLVVLKTWVENAAGKRVVEGEAVVLVEGQDGAN